MPNRPLDIRSAGTSDSPSARRKRQALIAVTALAILLIGAAFLLNAERREESLRAVRHTHQVQATATQAVSGLLNAETGQRGYLLTGRDPYLDPYRTGLLEYDDAMRRLRGLVLDNPTQSSRLDTLDTWAAKKREEMALILTLRRRYGLDSAAARISKGVGKAYMDSVRRVAADLERTEDGVLTEREMIDAERHRLALLIAAVGTIVAVGLVLLQGSVLSGAVARGEELSAELADRARQLEESAAELEMTNEELHSSNEQLNQTVEELQVTSEELESTNDELRFSNDELAQSEERFRTMAEALPIALFLCDRDGKTLYVNPAWCALTAVTPGRALEVGWAAPIHPDDRERVAREWAAALTGQRGDLHFRYVRPDGAVRHVRMTSEVSKTPTDEVRSSMGAMVDLTERLEVEEQLRHAQRMQAVGRLAGGMAHELNNMLTSAIGFAVFALRSLPADHKAVTDITESLKAQERAARITSQVLSFSRRQILEATRFEIGPALEDLLPLLRQSLTPAQVLVLEVPPNAGMVYADRTRLDQALVNAVLNARDAMPDGGTLRLTARRAWLSDDSPTGPEGERLAPGEYVAIAFADTGVGMDSETRRRALEPFFTTKPVGQGTGLGLSMTYGFVRQSGGTLTIESAPGRGTTVTLYLPVASEREAVADAPASLRVVSPSGEHVLVVDDEPSVRLMMRRALEQQGYEVIEASDGKEALIRLDERTGQVHLVVCDLVMPGMSGDALGATIRERWPALPVLYVSGFPDADQVESGMMPPKALFLRKPFAPDIFATRVRQVLDEK